MTDLERQAESLLGFRVGTDGVAYSPIRYVSHKEALLSLQALVLKLLAERRWIPVSEPPPAEEAIASPAAVDPQTRAPDDWAAFQGDYAAAMEKAKAARQAVPAPPPAEKGEPK